LKSEQSSTKRFELPGSIKTVTFSRTKNADPSTNDTFRGRTIDCKEQLENASDSIRFSCESDSNEIDESELHEAKQLEQRVSTFRGIMIDFNEQYENAEDSIRLSCEFGANETDENKLQKWNSSSQ
jgi:hypothetical protein